MTVTLPDLAALEAAAEVVYRHMPATPQHRWPLLAERYGCDVWVKHENHTPIAAFKLRGGLVYMDRLKRAEPDCRGVVTATTGNHGQSIALAARSLGLHPVLVCPTSTRIEKKRAMRAFGGELVEHGEYFEDARAHAVDLAAARGLHMMESFHPWLFLGVASYGLELLRAAPDLEAVYVPVGLGSGLCGLISARDALGHRARLIGVVPEGAPTYKLSFDAGHAVPTNRATKFVDSLINKVPNETALAIILNGAARFVTVSDADVRAAMRHYYTDTHNVAEPGGAAALAALGRERERMAGCAVGVILTGANCDLADYVAILTGED
ncbi:MAG: threonine dehydratase [Alphaproteobacteria bacterium]